MYLLIVSETNDYEMRPGLKADCYSKGLVAQQITNNGISLWAEVSGSTLGHGCYVYPTVISNYI